MGVDISPFIKHAQDVQAKTGIPASIILGQIMLESGGSNPGGLSGLAYYSKNLFGIKGKGTAGSATMSTTEVVNGRSIRTNAGFAKYNSYSDSIMAHAQLLSKPRYASKLKNAKSVEDYARGIKAAGYATDPNYANKLISIISKNNLHQYDSGDISFKPLSGDSTAGGGESSSGGRDLSFVSSIMYGTFRWSIIIGLAVMAVVFFMKAFPSVGDTAKGVASTGLDVVPGGGAVKTASRAAKKVKRGQSAAGDLKTLKKGGTKRA
ncbi:N-acetylmuramoyl-L-alanine amidase [Bacillus licheniformis]|uniref:glycoside hydrolase family 73 protein n=1 Tax=Bacillus subtilis group TaxID=653685 RepID=UPI0011EC81F6|nr:MULTISPECIES: glucosaminidase domain-containing protein [Bacillus subtilis group]KAA0817054.1 N-acetylmuramoyl-L-alanine amidase [Bacillus licheniformis]KAA0829953.1 N-acetylmuramoyl-L-alanine amidase [Bacillus licheniformis]KAA0835309.1 N-acetylmuramoyl-L-alanine amidase [Bacillus paralicheniformis]KAA0844465.1 N-acetylmuramoyl-L-alanine amidase [Bacillus licheniformis]